MTCLGMTTFRRGERLLRRYAPRNDGKNFVARNDRLPSWWGIATVGDCDGGGLLRHLRLLRRYAPRNDKKEGLGMTCLGMTTFRHGERLLRRYAPRNDEAGNDSKICSYSK